MKTLLSRKVPGSARDAALRSWVAGLAVVAVSFCGLLAIFGYRVSNPIALIVLAILAVGAEHESIPITPGIEVSVASILCVFAAVVFGPLPAIIVGVAGLLADLPRRDVAQPVLRWVNWTSVRILAAGGAGLTAVAVLSGGEGHGFWAVFAAVAAAFVVDTVVDLALAPVASALRGAIPWRSTVTSVGPAFMASVPLQALMVAILAYAYVNVSPWSVALFALPAVAAQRLLLLYRQQRETSEALVSANSRLARANLSFATALVATLDARDRYTAGHSAAVAVYARDIAARMGLSQSDQDIAHLCGLVHDVGKIGLAAGLLEKPGALTLDERRQMEEHSVIGERILRNVDDYGEIAAVVRHHHERVDGNGYPDQLDGDRIPLLARIIAVADGYNAMTSDRPYRDAMPSRVARLRLAQAVESQFDTSVVAAFEAILAGASEDYRGGRGAPFEFYAFWHTDGAGLGDERWTSGALAEGAALAAPRS
ncbi:MAG TPA: HD domain-containing phosphohydrolase [Gaiellaceae bacterium]|nr:HD domain-containing phosphohydrolase [Gaiellaceae bacterium]